MKRLMVLSIALLLGLALAVSPAAADEAKSVTLKGKVLCAKCTLHQEGQEGCQNVLVVEEHGKENLYYIAKNAVYDEFGEVCKGTRTVRMTGVVKDQDGKKWFTASEISPIEEKKS